MISGLEKRIFLGLMFSFLSNLLICQVIPVNDSAYYHNLSFVIKGGINTAPVSNFPASFTITDGDELVLHRLCNLKESLSYHFSIGAEYQISRNWSIQTGIDFLKNRMQLDYQQRQYNDVLAWHSSTKGTFEQDQLYLKIPVLFTYSFGKKIKWQVGAGLYWLSTKKIAGFWSHFNAPSPNAETCEVFEMPRDYGTREQITLLEMSNSGGLLHTQIRIPISWAIEVLVGSQYYHEFKALPSPSISRTQLIFETGFRFRFKHE